MSESLITFRPLGRLMHGGSRPTTDLMVPAKRLLMQSIVVESQYSRSPQRRGREISTTRPSSCQIAAEKAHVRVW